MRAPEVVESVLLAGAVVFQLLAVRWHRQAQAGWRRAEDGWRRAEAGWRRAEAGWPRVEAERRRSAVVCRRCTPCPCHDSRASSETRGRDAIQGDGHGCSAGSPSTGAHKPHMGGA